ICRLHISDAVMVAEYSHLGIVPRHIGVSRAPSRSRDTGVASAIGQERCSTSFAGGQAELTPLAHTRDHACDGCYSEVCFRSSATCCAESCDGPGPRMIQSPIASATTTIAATLARMRRAAGLMLS